MASSPARPSTMGARSCWDWSRGTSSPVMCASAAPGRSGARRSGASRPRASSSSATGEGRRPWRAAAPGAFAGSLSGRPVPWRSASTPFSLRTPPPSSRRSSPGTAAASPRRPGTTSQRWGFTTFSPSPGCTVPTSWSFSIWSWAATGGGSRPSWACRCSFSTPCSPGPRPRCCGPA